MTKTWSIHGASLYENWGCYGCVLGLKYDKKLVSVLLFQTSFIKLKRQCKSAG